MEIGHYNWLSKYCPNPSADCTDAVSLGRRYLISVCVGRGGVWVGVWVGV